MPDRNHILRDETLLTEGDAKWFKTMVGQLGWFAISLRPGFPGWKSTSVPGFPGCAPKVSRLRTQGFQVAHQGFQVAHPGFPGCAPRVSRLRTQGFQVAHQGFQVAHPGFPGCAPGFPGCAHRASRLCMAPPDCYFKNVLFRAGHTIGE